MLNAYMGYDRQVGSEEGACLIFAHTAREARKIAHPTVSGWFDTEGRDTAVRKLDKPYLFAQADARKLAADEAHVIEAPQSCPVCRTWGQVLFEHGCEYCQESRP